VQVFFIQTTQLHHDKMVDQVAEQVQQNLESSKASFDLKEFFQGNRNAVIIAVVAVIVLILGFVYYRNVQKTKEQEASLALSRISAYVDAHDYEKALNGDPTKKMRGNDIMGLLAIVDQYGSTNAGKTAALEAGVAELALDKADAAEKHFDLASGSDAQVVKAGAIGGLAACLERKSNFAEAAKTYEKAIAASEKINNKDRFEYYAALCYEKANDKENAIKWYKALIMEFEYSEFASDARSGLTRLGTVVD
jgi:predicted negative regulator of RcsB-dependent stress response